MAQRILFFENDARFAQEIRAALASRGVEVEITNDGNAGVDRAVEMKPDLILLTIELPGVNGFLVCKKLRKLAETQAIPMMILSSEATEEVFEQHRRLRTRAEDYIHKPIKADALIGRVHAILPLPPPTEEADVAFDSPSTELHSAAAAEAEVVDQEIDAFTDNAFDALVLGEDEATTIGVLPSGPKMAALAAAAARAAPPTETATYRTAPAEEPGEAAPPAAKSAPPEPASNDSRSVAEEAFAERVRDLEVALAEAERVAAADRERTKNLEEELRRAEAAAKEASSKSADVARLERELAEAKRVAASAPAAGAAPKASGSGRDILELQAQLNRKDKEALDVRDQLSAKEKQVLELRDRNLELERAQADANDRQLDLERQLIEVREAGEALASDKETISKRADDLKTRLERAEAKSKKLEEDLDGEKAMRSADVARLVEDSQKSVADLEERHRSASATAAAEAESLRTAMEEAHKEAAATAEAGHRARVEELEGSHAKAIADATAAHEAALARTRAELEEARESALRALRESSAQELSEAESRRESALAAAAAAQTDSLATLRSELESAAKAAMDESSRKHGSELASLGRKLAEAENNNIMQGERLEQTQADLDAARSEGATLTQTLTSTREELESTKGTLTTTSSDLEDARGRIATLHGRVEELEKKGAELESSLAKAREKITGDDAILERARRALSIGLSLLEDQKSNGSAAAE